MKSCEVLFLVTSFLVLIGQAIDMTYQDTLEDCKEFAKQFDNTCDTSKTPSSLSEMDSVNVNCDDDKLFGKCGFKTIAAYPGVHPIRC